MAIKQICGDWTDDNGYLNRNRQLRVELDGGKLRDAETGETLHCRQYGGDSRSSPMEFGSSGRTKAN